MVPGQLQHALTAAQHSCTTCNAMNSTHITPVQQTSSRPNSQDQSDVLPMKHMYYISTAHTMAAYASCISRHTAAWHSSDYCRPGHRLTLPSSDCSMWQQDAPGYAFSSCGHVRTSCLQCFIDPAPIVRLHICAHVTSKAAAGIVDSTSGCPCLAACQGAVMFVLHPGSSSRHS